MYDERRARLGKVSFAFKQTFWVSMGLLGYMLMILGPSLPGPYLALFGGFAAVSAIASIGLDLARGSNVVLWTALMLAVGAAILVPFLWYRESFIVNPPPNLFTFARPTPAPQ